MSDTTSSTGSVAASKSVLRIFSYVPNPRIAKATIVARLCDVHVDVRGATIPELSEWLWDFNARPIDAEEKEHLAHLVVKSKVGFTSTLYKTDEFLVANPFGNVPAAFDPSGRIGIFESNSIMRAVARVGATTRQLYGSNSYEASRIDGFLDASLGLGYYTQNYILALRGDRCGKPLYDSTKEGIESYLKGIERSLGNGRFIAGNQLSLADVAFACEFTMLQNERNFAEKLAKLGVQPLLAVLGDAAFPNCHRHFAGLVAHEAFAPDLGPYIKEPPLR